MPTTTNIRQFEGIQIKDGGAIGSISSAQALIISAAGEITKPIQPSFLAAAAEQLNATGDGTVYTITFTTELKDQNADFDGTSTFTAPVTGVYLFHATIHIALIEATHTTISVQITASNRTFRIIYMDPDTIASGGNIMINGAFNVDMDATDTAIVQITVSGTGKTADIQATQTQFGGTLIC